MASVCLMQWLCEVSAVLCVSGVAVSAVSAVCAVSAVIGPALHYCPFTLPPAAHITNSHPIYQTK